VLDYFSFQAKGGITYYIV